MHVEVTDEETERVVAIAGEIDSGTVEELRPILTAAGAADRTVVVDLRDVTFLDSCGLGLLVGTMRVLERSGSRFAVRNVPARIELAFRTSGLDRVLEILDAPGRR